jgi:hypothetical protein
MTATALPTKVLVFPDDVDVSAIPRRSYDFNAGDRRFFDQQEAIDHAHSKASESGIRQIVRRDSDVLGKPVYLVQAVGS